MKASLIAAAIAAASLSPIAVQAQAPAAAGAPAPTVGAKVYGPDGNEVGTVEGVQGDIVIVNTGAAKGGLPLTSFAQREKGLTIGYNKAQLEAALSSAAAGAGQKLESAFVADAQVKSSDDIVLGTISKIEGDTVTLALTDGTPVGLKKDSFGLGADGSLHIGMTEAALKAAVKAQTPAAAPPPTTN